MTTLSDRLKAALAESALTQADLARACSIKAPSVNAWISGRTKNLRGENLVRIAAALQVNIAWLANGQGPMRPAAGAHRIEQPAPVYGWPFKSLSAERFLALPSDERAQVERFALLLVTDWERRAAEKSPTAA